MLELPESLPVGPALVAVAILLAAAVFSGPSQAAVRPLSDTEMSSVRGADGSIAASIQPTGNGNNPLTSGLSQAFSSSQPPVILDAAGFAAALPAGIVMPDYIGQPVMQIKVDAAPVSFSFSVSDLLQATTGSTIGGGASMGTFTMNNFDARGTTLWVWTHH